MCFSFLTPDTLRFGSWDLGFVLRTPTVRVGSRFKIVDLRLKDSMETEIKPGAKVEFFESKKLLCAVCLEVKNSRVLVLTEQDREANVSLNRILHIDD